MVSNVHGRLPQLWRPELEPRAQELGEVHVYLSALRPLSSAARISAIRSKSLTVFFAALAETLRSPRGLIVNEAEWRGANSYRNSDNVESVRRMVSDNRRVFNELWTRSGRGPLR